MYSGVQKGWIAYGLTFCKITTAICKFLCGQVLPCCVSWILHDDSRYLIHRVGEGTHIKSDLATLSASHVWYAGSASVCTLSFS